MANIPLQYPFPYKTNNNTGFTNSVEFNTVTVLGDVTIDQNLTVAGNITTTDLTVGDDLTVGGNLDAQVLRAYGVWDVPTATVTGAGAWMGYNANGQTIFATRKSIAGQTNAFLWYTYDQTNTFVAELMHLNGTRLEVNTRLDIKTNGEMMRLVGTDHMYIRYGIGATDYGYIGFASSGTQDITLYNQRATGHIILDMANASGRIRCVKPILLEELVTIQTAPGSATYSFILPSSAGTTGQVLTSAGAGNPLYWSAGGGGGGGTVTNVTATSPLGVTSGTTTPNISITSSIGTGAVVLQTTPIIYGPNMVATTGGQGGNIQFFDTAHQIWGRVQYGATSTVVDALTYYAYGSHRFFTDGAIGSQTEKMRITSSGNVGIGTTAPSVKFHVVNGTGETGIFEASTNFGSVVKLVATATNGRTWKLQSTAIGDGDNPAGAFVIDDGTAGVRRFVINDAGNIGIGTNTPAQKLHVVNGAGSDTTIFETSAAGGYGSIVLKTPSYDFTMGLGGASSVYANLYYWYINGAPRLVVNTSGNIGIGTTTPTEKLAVNGNITTTDGSITAKSPGPGTPSSVAAASITIDSGTVGVSSINNTSTIYFITVGGGGGAITNYIESRYDATYSYYLKCFADNFVVAAPIFATNSINVVNNVNCNSKLESNGGNTGLEMRAIGGVSYIDMTAKSTSGAADYDFRISKANDNDVNFLNALGGNFIFNSGLHATNFSTDGISSFTYATGSFTPTIGFLTGATSNFVECSVNPSQPTFSYNFRTGLFTRIGNMMTITIDISFNSQLSIAAAPGIYIAIRLPSSFRPNTLSGYGANSGFPSTLNVANLRGYVLLNGTDSGGNIAYICPVDTNERMLWSIFGVSLVNNQRMSLSLSYNLQ